MLILFIALFWYFKPESEQLTCDQNYLCKVEQIRFGGHKTISQFQLSPHSTMHNRRMNFGTRRVKNLVYYVTFLEKSQEYTPFVYYTYHYDNRTDIERFKLYQQNPKDNDFILKSKTDENILRSAYLIDLSIVILFWLSIIFRNAGRFNRN